MGFHSLSKGQTTSLDAADHGQFDPSSVLAVTLWGYSCNGAGDWQSLSATWPLSGQCPDTGLGSCSSSSQTPSWGLKHSWAPAHLAEPHFTRTGRANQTQVKEGCKILQTCIQLQLSCKSAPADAHGKKFSHENSSERSISKASV